MKTINNQKGSAMLWTVLLTVIITILLGAIMTASYAYFDYTMYTVKRQQAYFTARSATDILIDQFTNVKLKKNSKGVYEETIPELLPEVDSEINDIKFNFPDSMMGTATADIKRSKKHKDQVKISVKATYADETYELNTKVARQPLYFAGVAIKDLTLNGGTLTLGQKTDLYWNNEAPFDIGAKGKINISGNLVTKGDAFIPAGSTVANHKFDTRTEFSDNNGGKRLRKVWNSNEYIISNKTLEVVDKVLENKHNSNITNIFDSTHKYCNNTSGLKGQYFGFPSVLDTDFFQTLLGFIKLDGIYADLKNQNMSLTSTKNDALTVFYKCMIKAYTRIDFLFRMHFYFFSITAVFLTEFAIFIVRIYYCLPAYFVTELFFY